jgi:glucose 1-dehydrogenase
MHQKDYYREHSLPEPAEPRCPVVQRLKGQTAVVTGANSGIGKAIAIALGHAGANVVVNYLDRPDAADDVVQELERCGTEGIKVQADVSQRDQVAALFESARKTFGTFDILVNNAGIQQDAAFEDISEQQWDAVMNVNLKGAFFCAQEAVREYKRRGVRPELSSAAGKIICISSVHELIPWAGHVNYAASKGGVMLMMKSLAQEVAPHRIRVNSISPGAIRTPINEEAWSTKEAYNDLMRLIPYKRIGEADEIGRAAVWLASDDSDYINGSSIYVDGGMTLYPGFETGG